MAKTLAQMTADIRAVNIEKGWRSADGSRTRTWGDCVALVHTEISEAVEAFRDHGLADATAPLDPVVQEGGEYDFLDEGYDFPMRKPEGVGSEFADLLIRLLDICDEFEVPLLDRDGNSLLGRTLAELDPVWAGPAWPSTFGGACSLLHRRTAQLLVPTLNGDGEPDPKWVHPLLGQLIAACQKYDINLYAEYERKVAYNRTREFRHGGRKL